MGLILLAHACGDGPLWFDGSSSEAPAVHLELLFSGRTFRGRFLLIDQEWGVLGRNVLNLLPILYDGPRLTWAVHEGA